MSDLYRIKPLEWVQDDRRSLHMDIKERWHARVGDLVRITVTVNAMQMQYSEYHIIGSSPVCMKTRSADELKAKVEAAYRERLLAALEPVEAP